MCYEIKRNRSFKIRVQNSFAKSKHPPCISSIFFCYFSRILIKNIDKNISAWMLSNVVSIILFALKFNCKILGTLNRVCIGYLANCGNNPRETIIDRKRSLSFVIGRQILNASLIFLSEEKVTTGVLGNKSGRLRFKVDRSREREAHVERENLVDDGTARCRSLPLARS